MAIEINGLPGAPTNNKQVEQTNASRAGTVTSNTSSPSTTATTGTPNIDSFTVSQQAEKLRVIESNINAQPDIDGARIESLKTAIDAGQYDINPLRVAEKLIELETQFVA